MQLDEHLDPLIDSWRERQANGRRPTAAEICGERVDLIDLLEERIALLEQSEPTTAPKSLDSKTGPFNPVASTGPQVLSPVHVGDTFAGFRLLSVLGEGGFGTVFRAEDLKLRRKVALKVLHARALARDGARESFLEEARALAAVHHDHVVPIFQVGEEAGQPFLAMPLLAGESLASRLERSGGLPVAEVRRIGREIALGLAAIHAKGLIHRDLKPGNIWLEADTGRVKVLDLGLARDPNATRDAVAGTPAYMSPEQAVGDELDFRSDLFSLGTVLYECSSGKRAFSRDSLHETLRSIREDTPPPVSRLNPGVSKDLSTLIDRLHSKSPEARPGSALEVADSLTHADARTQPPVSPRSRRWLFVAGGTAVLVIATIFAIANQYRPRTVEPTSSGPAEPIVISAVDVRPHRIAIKGNVRAAPLELLGTKDSDFSLNTKQGIKVDVTLSRPAYAYIVIFQGDGKDHVLWPQDDTNIPEKTARPLYPSKRREELWGLTDGPGLWVIAVIASDQPLPSYRDWRAQHPGGPWQSYPAIANVIMRDDGIQGFEAYTPEVHMTRGPRGAVVDPNRTPVTTLVDWLHKESQASVSALAFPVVPE